MKLSEDSNNFIPCPAGSHAARCFQVIDFGTQPSTFNGETKLKKKFKVTWEIPAEKRKNKDGIEVPYTVSKSYSQTLAEKSTLRADLASWRGRDLDDADRANFDITKILGKPCLLAVIHEKGPNGVYAKVSAISPMPKGMQCEAQVNANKYFTLDEFSQSVFDSLNEFDKKKIEASPEYKAILSGSFDKQETKKGNTPVEFEEPAGDDEVPF